MIMTVQSPRTRARRLSKDKRMAEILKVARATLRERGAENFATSEVAKLCGISEGTIYKYFTTRRDLMIKVTEQWFSEFVVEEEHPSDRELTVRDRLLLAVRRHLSVIRAEPQLTRFLLTDLRSDPSYRSMPLFEMNRQAAKRFMDIMRDGIASGDFRPDIDLRLARNMLLGCIEYSIWSYLRGEGDFAVESTARAISDLIFDGIVCAPAQQGHSLTNEIERLARLVSRLEASTPS